MKYLLIILSFTLLLASCGKNVVDTATGSITETGEVIIETPLEDISLADVSEQTGISEKELGELMDEEVILPIPNISELTIEGRGTEPFWYFTASDSTLIWKALWSLDIETETLTGVTLSASGSDYNISGSGISASVTLGLCSDGMSDLSYDYTATVTKWVTNFNGCANVD